MYLPFGVGGLHVEPSNNHIPSRIFLYTQEHYVTLPVLVYDVRIGRWSFKQSNFKRPYKSHDMIWRRACGMLSQRHNVVTLLTYISCRCGMAENGNDGVVMDCLALASG